MNDNRNESQERERGTSPWAEALLAPISEAAPAGVDARQSKEYAAVEAEFEREQAIAKTAPVDWGVVVENAEALLREQTKDLTVATYLVVGLHMRDGLEGLGRGLTVLTGLLSRYWESLHPTTRLRRRVRRVEWLIGRIEAKLDAISDPAALTRATVIPLEEAVRALDTAISDAFGDAAPSLRGLTQTCTQFRKSLPPERAPAKPTALQPAASTNPASATPAAPSPRSSATPLSLPDAGALAVDSNLDAADVTAVRSSVTKIGEHMVKLGRAIRQARPADPLGHRLIRAGLWIHFTTLPPVKAGKTGLAPVEPRKLANLDRMAEAQLWSAVADECASLLQAHRLSLDLQRHEVFALRNMGSDYDIARREIELETVALIERLPGLVELKARDGSPLADDETRRWLSGLGGGGAGENVSAGDEHTACVLRECRAIEETGEVDRALASLQEGVAACVDGRARFELRRELARLCTRSGNPAVASRIYAELYNEITARGLDEWEPALAAECLSEFIRCASSLGERDRARLSVDAAHDRLCALDPERAVTLARSLEGPPGPA